MSHDFVGLDIGMHL